MEVRRWESMECAFSAVSRIGTTLLLLFAVMAAVGPSAPAQAVAAAPGPASSPVSTPPPANGQSQSAAGHAGV